MSDQDRVAATAPSDALARLRAAGRRAVLVTVTTPHGRRRPGLVVLDPDGSPQATTVTDDGLMAAATALGTSALADPTARTERIADPGHPDVEVELVAEVYDPEPAVLVLGATEASRALVRVAAAVPTRATLVAPGGAVDVPHGVEVRADDPARVLLAAPPGSDDAVIVGDPAATWTLEALRVALASDAAYVGIVVDEAGARRLRRRLTDAGIGEARVARLHAPAGLPAEERAVGEVALAALAQAIAARRRRRAS